METETNADVIARQCPKCSSKGHIVGFEGIDGGRCWTCGGQGHLLTTAKREANRKAAAKRRAAKREANEAARVQAFVLSNMRKAQAAGLTLREYHDSVCACAAMGQPCDLSGQHADDWSAAAVSA